jgi:hypothetical protein
VAAVRTVSQEQLIASDEENQGLKAERCELHSLLNDTAQELDQKKRELAAAEGMQAFVVACKLFSNVLVV